MYLLSPIILGCASSSSCFSWFAHVPLIANTSWLCLVVFVFQLVCPISLIASSSWPNPIVFVFQLVCPIPPIASSSWPDPIVFVFQLVCPVPSIASNSWPTPSSSCSSWFAQCLLSAVILGQTNTFTPRCLMRSVANDNIAAYIRHRGASKIQAYYLACRWLRVLLSRPACTYFGHAPRLFYFKYDFNRFSRSM